jgi:PAS domain S-box-containing protein
MKALQIVWLFANAIVSRDGNRPIRMSGAIFDITDRKQAEETFRLAVEASPSGMILTNGEGRIVLINGHAEALFGYSRHELLGQPVEILIPQRIRSSHAEFRTAFGRQPEVRAMGKGRDLFARRKDGAEIPVEVGLSPIRTQEGHMILSAVVDITERKRASELQETLAREIQHRSNNLLSVVQTIARRTLSDDASLKEARQKLDARFTALARVQQKLTDANWRTVSLEELVHSELEAFAAQITAEGPQRRNQRPTCTQRVSCASRASHQCCQVRCPNEERWRGFAFVGRQGEQQWPNRKVAMARVRRASRDASETSWFWYHAD